jgi:sugar (pentulose or hexulose) kinase
MKAALAIDLGTTSISGAAVSAEGQIVARVQRANTAAVDHLSEGHAEQNPQQLRAIAVQVLRELQEQISGVPYCLGLTGQMHGLLMVDETRRPLSNLITWQDRRANESMSPGEPSYLESYLSNCDEGDLQNSGCRLAPGYLAVTLFVLSQRKQLPEDTSQALFLADWIAAELCDCIPVTDRSNAASSGIYNLRDDRWSSELIEAGGFSQSLFPSVKESGAVIGELTSQVAAQTGLPAGLPVCNAIGDNQAAVLGSVPSCDPAIQINVGTGGQINWPIDRFKRVDGMDTRYLPHNRFMLVGAGLAGGDAYAWVNQTASEWLKSLGIESSQEEIYARMNESAAMLTDENNGLICEPLFRGTRRDPNVRGTFSGIGYDNFTLGHVARSVLQGIAAGMYSFYEQASESRPEHLRHIVGSGNGLRKNKLLIEILEKIFKREIRLPIHQEAAAFGVALLAGSSTGLWPDLETAGSKIRLVSAREAD